MVSGTELQSRVQNIAQQSLIGVHGRNLARTEIDGLVLCGLGSYCSMARTSHRNLRRELRVNGHRSKNLRQIADQKHQIFLLMLWEIGFNDLASALCEMCVIYEGPVLS